MRTDAEMRKFARACERIEKDGGDVLGYVAREYPSYSPRATWRRLQKDQLGRKEHQLTDGRPKEKGVNDVGKMMELAQGALEAYGRGESVYEYLARQGQKNPSAYWHEIKSVMKKKDPDLYEKLSAIRTNGQRKKAIPETVIFEGKEYEKVASPSCCQLAKPSGVALEDMPEEPSQKIEEKKITEKPEGAYPIGNEEITFKVSQLKSRLGAWETRDDRYIFIANDSGADSLNMLELGIRDWLNLAAEIPKAIKKLTEIN